MHKSRTCIETTNCTKDKGGSPTADKNLSVFVLVSPMQHNKALAFIDSICWSRHQYGKKCHHDHVLTQSLLLFWIWETQGDTDFWNTLCRVQPGAVKLVLWRLWMHLSYTHPVTSENQIHCTRLYIVVPWLQHILHEPVTNCLDWVLGSLCTKTCRMNLDLQGRCNPAENVQPWLSWWRWLSGRLESVENNPLLFSRLRSWTHSGTHSKFAPADQVTHCGPLKATSCTLNTEEKESFCHVIPPPPPPLSLSLSLSFTCKPIWFTQRLSELHAELDTTRSARCTASCSRALRHATTTRNQQEAKGVYDRYVQIWGAGYHEKTSILWKQVFSFFQWVCEICREESTVESLILK